ncbi:MAG TPA: FAD-linked oxidase C-terminal domain-containing protein, partial [Rectinemataceae bacterium]|nr:FAD-linked oxidase C-terminal domain-containing protein [Rectinemataceae bacterium]
GLARMRGLLAPHAGTEAFFARDRAEAEEFWAVRKKLGAIARRTNAFKLNEDVVLPLPRLAEFAAFIDELNLGEERHNQREIAAGLRTELEAEARSDPALSAKMEGAGALFAVFEGELASAGRETLRSLRPATALRDGLLARFAGHESLEKALPTVFGRERARLIKVATHMHAGDGNVHCNIPVFSNDRVMMARADATTDRVMRQALALGGVVSGEHGIGLTKIRYLETERIAELEAHRAALDPLGLMSPGALRDPGILDRVFTPSFNLLGLEARILQHDGLAELAAKIQGCVRCGKCKLDCCVNIPERAMGYHPRNKNMAIGSIIEALLYDAQRNLSASFDVLHRLEELADHCTICHKCRKPCPVDIDTGEVSMLERAILKDRGLKHTSLATKASLAYLEKGKDRLFQSGFRLLVLGAGMRGQRLVSRTARVLPRTGRLRLDSPLSLMSSPIPLSKGRPLPEALPRYGERQALLVAPPEPNGKTVFYFPGCGSERLHGAVGRASLYLLLKAGVQVVLPPAGLCCGYPFGVNGRLDKQKAIELADTIIFNQIREMFSYLEFDAVVLSCGTCTESLGHIEASRFFDAPLRDLSEFALEAGLEHGGLGEVMYHKPCHDSLDGKGAGLIARAGGRARTLPHCCGEAGTLALSRPDIAVDLHDRKAAAIVEALAEKPTRRTLVANCPSCIQGLGRHEDLGVEVKHLAMVLAEAAGGRDWEAELETMTRGAEAVTF